MADTNKDNVWIEDRAIQAWEQSIEATLNTGIHHLRFPFQQEERFQEYYAEKFSGQISFAIFLGLLVALIHKRSLYYTYIIAFILFGIVIGF